MMTAEMCNDGYESVATMCRREKCLERGMKWNEGRPACAEVNFGVPLAGSSGRISALTNIIHVRPDARAASEEKQKAID